MIWKAKHNDQWYATVDGYEEQYLPVAGEPKPKHEAEVREAMEKGKLRMHWRSISDLVQCGAEVYAGAEG